MSISNELDKWRTRLIDESEIWQFDLLTAQKLWKFCADRGVRHFNYKVVESLWAIALIRADLIIATSPVEIDGLTLVKKSDDSFYYLDNRKAQPRSIGYGGSFEEAQILENVTLYFHPFRFYLLYHVARVFGSNISKTQFLSHPPGHLNVVNHENEFLAKYTAKLEFLELFANWNKIAETAIVLEPCSYNKVFGQIRWHHPDTEETIIEKLNRYRNDLNDAIETNDRKVLEEFRQKLCMSAEEIDDNKVLHVLLRLTTWHRQQKITSAIGGALLLSSMAEIIRRPVEGALDIYLPEEDELGFGQWSVEGRRMTFGTDRVLDAKPSELRDFMLGTGLSGGNRVRCYVEGETEYGALKRAFEQYVNIQIINLYGSVAEKNKKGVAFKDSLRNDLKAQDFSFVYIDGDREDFLRVVKKAAEEDILTGGFFVSKPDIEFENFTVEELIEAALQMAKDMGVPFEDKNKLLEEAKNAVSGNDFFDALGRAGVDKAVCKGELWGDTLMKYAIDNSKDCHMLQVVEDVFHTTRCGFQNARQSIRIDPMTGRPIRRVKDVEPKKKQA